MNIPSIILVCLTLPYFVMVTYYGIVLCRKLGKSKAQDADSKDISLGVVVAFRNEEQNLPRLIEAILNQDYKNYELYLCDDGSDDASCSVIEDYAKLHSNIKLLRSTGCGKKAAIATAVMQCSQDYIVCTDADCIPERGWLGKMAEIFAKEQPELIIAPVNIRNGGWFQTMDNMSLQAVTAACALQGKPVMANGANMAFKKSAYLESIGKLHFSVASGDDMFLLQNIRQNGGKILYANNIQAATSTAATSGAKAFIVQHARWLSKSGSYSDPWIIFWGLLVFFTQIILILSLVFVPIAGPAAMLTWALKVAADSILMLPWARFTGQTKRFWAAILPASAIYPFYTLTITLYTIFGKTTWKRRRI